MTEARGIRRSTSIDGARTQECLLKMDEAVPVPLGVESYIVVRVGNRQFEGIVPSEAVRFEAEQPVIPGMRLYLGDGGFVISLPASSMGTATWHMTEEEMHVVEFRDS